MYISAASLAASPIFSTQIYDLTLRRCITRSAKATYLTMEARPNLPRKLARKMGNLKRNTSPDGTKKFDGPFEKKYADCAIESKGRQKWQKRSWQLGNMSLQLNQQRFRRVYWSFYDLMKKLKKDQRGTEMALACKA